MRRNQFKLVGIGLGMTGVLLAGCELGPGGTMIEEPAAGDATEVDAGLPAEGFAPTDPVTVDPTTDVVDPTAVLDPAEEVTDPTADVGPEVAAPPVTEIPSLDSLIPGFGLVTDPSQLSATLDEILTTFGVPDDFEIPDLSIPDVNLPDLPIFDDFGSGDPESDLPESDVPETDVPVTEVPDTDDLDVPDASEFELPTLEDLGDLGDLGGFELPSFDTSSFGV